MVLVQSSPQCMEDFSSGINHLNKSLGHSGNEPGRMQEWLQLSVLIIDIVTQWNSTYYMLKQAWTYHKVGPWYTILSNMHMFELDYTGH
jgi:hypothetical protein